MDEEKVALEPAEPQYFISPHPAAAAPLGIEAAAPQEPVAAEDSLADLVQQAVEELRGELQSELETQVFRMQSDLRSELKIAEKGLEINAKT